MWRTLYTPVWGSLNPRPPTMIFLHGYTWPVGLDSSGSSCVLAYQYLLRPLLRSAWVLGPFALLCFVVLVDCIAPMCAQTCAYTSSTSACVNSSEFIQISLNMENNLEWRSLHLSDRTRFPVSPGAWRVISIRHCYCSMWCCRDHHFLIIAWPYRHHRRWTHLWKG
jgi:hypothetical protein